MIAILILVGSALGGLAFLVGTVYASRRIIKISSRALVKVVTATATDELRRAEVGRLRGGQRHGTP